MYRTLDILNLFPVSITSIELVKVNKQRGGLDCVVFAVVISIALAFGQNPAMIRFDQPAMHPHLVACFEKGQLTQFPSA